MADLTRVIKVLFKGDDQLTPMMNSMSNDINDFGNIAGDIADPFADIADNVLKLDAALTALAVGGLAYAFTKSMDFETSSVNLSKILGEEKDQIEGIEQAAISLSNTYGETSTSVLDSATNFKKAGFSIQESMELTEEGIRLVMAAAEAEFDVAASTETIISVLKGFHAPASEAARLTDILNKVANEYATNVTQLATGMAQIAPIASRMGFSFEETAGMLTPVIEVFRSGEEAAVALKMGLIKLTDDAKPVQDALTALGVAQKDANGKLRSGRDIMFDVARAFKEADKNDKLYLMTQLVGIRQAARMSEVFDNLSKVVAVTSTAMSATGSVTQEVAEKLKTSQVAVDRFKTGFENLALTIGNEFRVAATSAIEGGGEISRALADLVKDGTFDPILRRVERFADDMGDTLSKIAENAPEAFENVDFDELLKSFDDLGDQLKSVLDTIWGDLDLTTPQGLADAIQKVIDGFTALTNVTTGILQGMRPLFEIMSSLIENFRQADEETAKMVGQFLGAAKTVKVFADNIGILGIGLGILKLGAIAADVTVLSGAMKTATPVARGFWIGVAGPVGIGVLIAGALIKGTDAITKWAVTATNARPATDEMTAAIEDYASVMSRGDIMAGIDGISQNLNKLSKETEQGVYDLQALRTVLKDLPASQQMEIISLFKKEGMESALKGIAEIPKEKIVDVYAEVDMATLIEIENKLRDVPEEKQVLIRSLMDAGLFKSALAMLDGVPEKKEVNILTYVKQSQDGIKLLNDIANFPEEKAIQIQTLLDAGQWYEAGAMIEDLVRERDLKITTDTKDVISEVDKASRYIYTTFPDGSIVIDINPHFEKKKLDAEKKKVDKKLDPLKILEIEAKVDVAKIQANAEIIKSIMGTINTQIEWSAKIDIAQIEAEADMVVAAFESIAVSVAAVSDTVGDMFGTMLDGWNELSSFDQYEFMNILEDEMKMQKDLIDAQIDLLKARTKAMESGDAAKIEIKSTNLSPALEMIFQEVLEMTQVTANAEGLELLGV